MQDLEEKNFDKLLVCIAYEEKAELERLVESGVDVNAQNLKGMTPLMVAIMLMKYDIIKTLIEHGAYLHIKDHRGADALDYAIDTPRHIFNKDIEAAKEKAQKIYQLIFTQHKKLTKQKENKK